MTDRYSSIKKYATGLAYYVLPWALVAFFLSFISFFVWGEMLHDKGWLAFFLFELICIAPWILFTPAIVRLYRRFDFKKPKQIKSLFAHFIAIVFCFSIHCIVQTLAVFNFFEMDFNVTRFWLDFIGFLNMRIIFYVGIVMTVKVFDFYQRDREMTLKEPRLRSELNKTKFQVLKNQLQPQFLHATLDSVMHNINNQPEVAEEIVIALSDLLRVMLDLSNPEKVEVLNDLRHLSLYIEILNKKTGKHIKLITDVPPECYDARIPTVIYLIPFFETIHTYNLEHSGSLKKIEYKVDKRFSRLYHSIILEAVKINSHELYQILNKARFKSMVDHLRRSYSSRFQLNCSIKDNRLKIVFELPLKEEPMLEERLNKRENVYK